MIARNTERLPPAYRPYYRNFLVGTITDSKRYQRLLVSGLRVAYSGVEGAFAHVATMRIFGEPGEKVACPDFATAYRSVESGACHCAVLPIENSYAGDVGQVMDLAWRGSLTISGIYDLPLSQCLLAKPGVTLTLLWEEYCRKCYEGGHTPYMSTQFGDKYRKWARITKATMRIQHKPGDAIQVDWAGDTVPVYDSVTGAQSAAICS